MSEEKKEKKEERKKFAPSLSQLETATARLPDPNKNSDMTFETFVNGDASKTIVFEKIKLLKSDGTKVKKWSYKGRIFIDSKYITTDKD